MHWIFRCRKLVTGVSRSGKKFNNFIITRPWKIIIFFSLSGWINRVFRWKFYCFFYSFSVSSLTVENFETPSSSNDGLNGNHESNTVFASFLISWIERKICEKNKSPKVLKTYKAFPISNYGFSFFFFCSTID